MSTVIIDAGTLTANRTERLVTGLLLPYGEECRSNLGKFSFAAGTVELPADLTGMSFNTEHEREKVIGAPVSLTDTAAGVVATFKIATTPEGDQALDDIATGKRKHLSAEVADVKIKDGKGIAGRLFAAALVETPAFPSATLLAAAVDTLDDDEEPPAAEPVTTEEKTSAKFIDEAGVEHVKTTTIKTVVDGDKTTITTTEVIEEPEPTPAVPPTDEKEPAVNAVPNTLNAGNKSAAITPRPTDLRTLFAAMNRAKVRQATDEDLTLLAASSAGLGGSPEQVARTLMAALSDIKVSGSGSLPVGGAAIQPNWVGHLDQGIAYERQFVPLAKLGTAITAEGKKGYKVHRGTSGAPVDSYAAAGNWAGNKAAIGSGTGWTDPFTSVLDRFAFGEDIAREYTDLPGGEEVLAAFFSLIKEDHLVWSDEIARNIWIAMAGAPTAAASYPAGYSAALGIVMQAIRRVNRAKADKRRDRASFVIVNDEAAEAIDYTPFEQIPEFIKFSWNLDRSDLKAGDVVLVNGDNGITGSPAALAGASYALELDELAGGPLWIDALDIAKGGVDRAIHGYLQSFQVRPEAVQIVGTPAARANSTAYPVGRLITVSAVVYRVTVAGTSGGSAPTAPAVGATVADGTATLLRLV
jgi:hypothetical protein